MSAITDSLMMFPRQHAHQAIPVFFLVAMVILCWVLYQPGLTGPFLLDDAPNIDPLAEAIQNPDKLDGLINFVTSGQSGPTGRPLSMASFYLDGLSGLTEATVFKRTNILIHLLNGVLIAWLFWLLIPLYTKSKRFSWVPFVGAALWLLHPLSVSTVLYVVQRMTLLMAAFSLCAIIGYLYGRRMLDRRPFQGYVVMSFSLVFFGVLATLSKENGALILLYCMVIEWTIPKTTVPSRAIPALAWKAIFLYLPVLAGLVYLIWNWEGLLSGYGIREFNLLERLSTETVVMADYARSIFFPSLGDGTVFYDDYKVIKPSLFTVLLFLFYLVVLYAAFHMRRKQPLLSLAVLWFVVGHSLESTVFPLELYFEHRNYLPMAIPILAASYYVSNWLSKHEKIKTGIVTSVLALFSSFVFLQSSLWGDDVLLAEVSYRNHPDSVRAYQYLASVYANNGDYHTAHKVILEALQKHPDNPGLLAQATQLSCLKGKAEVDKLEKLARISSIVTYDNAIFSTMKVLSGMAEDGKCLSNNRELLRKIVIGLRSNPKYNVASALGSLYYIEGFLWFYDRNLNRAMGAMDEDDHKERQQYH